MKREIILYYPGLTKHNITEKEVIEILKAEKHYKKRIDSKHNPRYLYIAKTQEGKIVELIYRIEKDGSMFIFHAMEAKETNKNLYKKRSKK